jgi:hypothetical protein
MGLTTPALKFILSLSQKYHFKGPILTFGNQDIYTDAATLKRWQQDFGLKPLKSSDIKPSTSLGLNEINNQSSTFVHAETFFKLIGIKSKDYYDVDKFSFDKPRILHDLEKPLPVKYHNFFNLIIDSGTLEHIFDIKSVMQNTVEACKVGGYVLQLIPTNNFINHGFYQISPTLFYDFYTANGFKVEESFLVEFRPSGYRFHYYDQKNFSTFFVNPYSRIVSLFLVKKVKSIKVTTTPTQYAYQQVINRQKSHKKSVLFDKYTDKIRRIFPFKYHPYFFIPWVIYKQLFSKKKYFDIAFE